MSKPEMTGNGAGKSAPFPLYVQVLERYAKTISRYYPDQREITGIDISRNQHGMTRITVHKQDRWDTWEWSRERRAWELVARDVRCAI